MRRGWDAVEGTLDLSGIFMTAKCKGIEVRRSAEWPAAEIERSGPANIRWLILDVNELKSVPGDQLAQLSGLEDLSLSDNHLTAMPAEIGRLSALRALRMSYNRLTALPAEIGQLSALQSLDVSFGQLTALPAEIGRLSALKELDVSGNHLSALPSEIGRLLSLEVLNVNSNLLAAVPEQIGRLPRLQELNLSGNPLSDLPASVRASGDAVLAYLRTLPPPIASPRATVASAATDKRFSPAAASAAADQRPRQNRRAAAAAVQAAAAVAEAAALREELAGLVERLQRTDRARSEAVGELARAVGAKESERARAEAWEAAHEAAHGELADLQADRPPRGRRGAPHGPQEELERKEAAWGEAEQRAADAERRAAEAEAAEAAGTAEAAHLRQLLASAEAQAAAAAAEAEEAAAEAAALREELAGAVRLSDAHLRTLAAAQLDELAGRLHEASRRVGDLRVEAVRREAEGPAQCSVCMERPVGVTLQPCGHTKLCVACADKLWGGTRECPECRQPITQRIRAFL